MSEAVRHGPRISGLFAGAVETFIAPDGRPLTTAIRKKAFARLRLEPGGFVGDESSEKDHHTPDRAVHFFSAEYYEAIEARLGVSLPRPSFGENLTTTGLRDVDVRVGDLLAVGGATLCVTLPTERCRTIGRRLGLPKILKATHDLAICGFYAKVVTSGEVAAGDEIRFLRRADHDWTIARLHHFMFNELADRARMADALALPDLSDEWKARVLVMRGRAERGEPLSSSLADL